MSETDPKTPRKPFLVGYARVSTDDQDSQRQIDALVEYGVNRDDIFTDKASGATLDRPGWKALWKDIRAGDCVVIVSLDRMSRSTADLLVTMEEMHKRGVNLKMLTGDIDTRTPFGGFAFTVLAAVAEMERKLILERTRDGLARSRERGVIGGRPTTITVDKVLEALERQAKGETLPAIATSFGVSYGGLKKAVDRHRKAPRTKENERGQALKPRCSRPMPSVGHVLIFAARRKLCALPSRRLKAMSSSNASCLTW